MKIKSLVITTILLTSTIWSQAQQINAVPDYVFRNQMSVGRNAVTDTAAYFSIGPRYGATRGMMPPMVVDTASFSGNKRNGLLIFSVQKNKFLYWDSVGVKWAEMAGTGGSAITGSGVAGYLPEFTTTTNLDTTRLYHSAGRFAIGSTTTSNGVFNVYGGLAYFDTTLQVGTQTLIANESTNEVLINQSSDAGAYALQVGGDAYFNGDIRLDGTTDWGIETSVGGEMTNFQIVQRTTNSRYLSIDSAGNLAFGRLSSGSGNNASIYVNTNKELLVGYDNTGDQGDYKLQVNGAIFSSNGFYFFRPASTITRLEVGNSTVTSRIESDAGNSQMSIGTASNHPVIFKQNDGLAFFVNTGKEIILNATGVDAGAYKLQVDGNIYGTGSITTGAPSGGSIKPWKIGEAATVSPTSPNRTIRVEIDGTVYYIHAKTTND